MTIYNATSFNTQAEELINLGYTNPGLMLYTSNWYKGVNAELRDGIVSEMAQAIDKELESLPCETGIVYRGTSRERFLNVINGGSTFSDLGYLSTSKDDWQAANFAYLSGGIPAILKIHGKSGRSIDEFSATRGENEVLFPRGSTFEWRNEIEFYQDKRGLIAMFVLYEV